MRIIILLSSELFINNIATFHSISLKRKFDSQIDSCIELLDSVKVKRNKIYNENIKLDNGGILLPLPLSSTDLETIYTDLLVFVCFLN